MRKSLFYYFFCYVGISVTSLLGLNCLDFFQNYGDPLRAKFLHFSEELRLEMVQETKKMFYFGYDSYMSLAFPLDELNPIYCVGRGPDYDNPSNININDILGNFSLTLVDTLDTLVIMGNYNEFQRAVRLVLDNVSFDQNTVIQVFEANIRLLGGLLSAHLLLKNPWNIFPEVTSADYDNELLHLAHDLATRLLPAFENTEYGIPHPRVHLREGIPVKGSLETCTAGAGSLLVEFGLLSRLLGDPVYENVARRASEAIWNLRHKDTGLLGFTLDISTGKWTSRLSGVGAGMDSYYEYLLKSSIILGHADDLQKFKHAYSSIKQHMRRGRPRCNEGIGEHPLYVNVDISSGAVITTWVDSLQASFAGVQSLDGDLEEAICSHAFYYALWKKYSALPERFNWQRKEPDVFFYPLRPEFAESTYLLYQATKNPFYLHVGRDIVESLNAFAKAPCGYATLHSVVDKTQEDRMESFFLSETCKYLYLLFDTENPVNKHADRFIFTTEGHLIPLLPELRRTPWSDIQESGAPERVVSSLSHEELLSLTNISVCNAAGRDSAFSLPLKKPYLVQLFETMEVDF